jgi:hypothetical protein
MILSRGSVPIAASMSANRATSSCLGFPIILYFDNNGNIEKAQAAGTPRFLEEQLEAHPAEAGRWQDDVKPPLSLRPS